jgi:hypothetical protein
MGSIIIYYFIWGQLQIKEGLRKTAALLANLSYENIVFSA